MTIPTHDVAPFSVPLESLKSWPEGKDESNGLAHVLEGEYDLNGVEQIARVDWPANPIILDIGANVGSFSVWASARWPTCTIYAYEPNPQAYTHLEKNVGENVVVRKTAVSNFDGKTLLYLGANNLGEASLVDRGQQDKTKAGVVRVVHARGLPEADIIKIDTEGSERTIIENYAHWDGVKAVMLEYHSHEDRNWIRHFMVTHGFTTVLDVERNWRGFGLMKFVRIRPIRLYIAVLCGSGQVFIDHEHSMEALKQIAPYHGVELIMPKNIGTGVDRARNRSWCEGLRDPNITHFMFVDSDIEFDPMWVINMVKSDLDVVAGAYPRKIINWGMVAAAVRRGVPDEELGEHSTDWIINYCARAEDGTMEGVHIEGLGDFLAVEEAGTGFLMAKREVVEKMIEAYGHEMAYVCDYPPKGQIDHTLFACQIDPACPRENAKRQLLRLAREFSGPHPDADQEYGEGKTGEQKPTIDDLVRAVYKYGDAVRDPKTMGRYLTEDYAFCRLWRMLGGKIWLYIDAKLKHIGPMTFEGAAAHYFHRVEDGK